MGGLFSGDDKGKKPVAFKSKLGWFFANHWRGVLGILTPLLFLPLIIPPKKVAKFRITAYALCVMAVYWVAEVIPLPITGFLPIFMFPTFDIMPGIRTCERYVNDTIFVFLGSLMLATAIEQSGLHTRMALCAVRTIGYSHYKLLFAISFMTMFASMWMTNTAATTMFVPITFALLHVFEDQGLIKIFEGEGADVTATDITSCYFCSVTFSATIGGIGTLVGTGTNLVFKGLLESTFPQSPDYLSFPMFSAFTIPPMILMEICLYFSMIFVYLGFLRPNSATAKSVKLSPEGIKAAKLAVERQTKAIGSITFWEIMVGLTFTLAILLFFTRSPQMFPGWGDKIHEYFDEKGKFIRDSAVATCCTVLMVLLPANMDFFKNFTAKTREELPKKRIPSVLDWTAMDASMPWSFMFLLGGGFSISGAATPQYSDLNGVIGKFLSNMSSLPNALLLLVLIIITIFITNFASNVAVATVIVPIGMTLAIRIGANPLLYNMAAGLAASFCYMLPVGTPGNLVVQSAAKVSTQKMIVAGILPTITTTLILWLALMFWAPVIWPDMKKHPKDLPWAAGG